MPELAEATSIRSIKSRSDPTRFVLISGYHDYRSKRRANLHFISDELAKRGEVFFLSERFSYLTLLTEDPRHDLWSRSNRLETIGNIACYLWRTPIHACRLPRSMALLERALFAAVAGHLPRPALSAITTADIIFIESGIAIIHAPLVKRLAPNAKLIYLASDTLGAINQADSIRRAFQRHAHLFDSARLPSPLLRHDVPASIPCYFIPHGIEKERFDAIGPSPYLPGTCNAVSVGSMLFDPTFFRVAAPMFPNVTFHVIGSGHRELGPPNIIYHPEIPFEATLPYIKHADFAIAPYGDGVAPYLTHTSMKLMQYAYLSVPAVCPQVVAGADPARFGYSRDQDHTIYQAVSEALSVGHVAQKNALSWSDVVDRLIYPARFNGTTIPID